MAAASGLNRREIFSQWGRSQKQAAVARPLRPELVVERRAMACEFSLRFPAGSRRATDAGCAALDEVELLESKLSVYCEDSDISCLNRGAAESAVHVDAGVYRLLRLASRLSAATGGAFDATTGALVRAWGFLHGPKRVPSESELAAALAGCGSRHIEFDDTQCAIRARRPGIEFNLGGIGKGFAIDRALELVRGRFAIRCALMQGGQSSLKGIGAPPGEGRGWPVAIADPLRPGRAVARVWLRDRAMGTSAADHQSFVDGGRRFGHILDPRTGWPARRLHGAPAIATSAAEAAALSTAFFVMGADETRRFCAEHPQYGAVLVAPEVLTMGAADVELTS